MCCPNFVYMVLLHFNPLYFQQRFMQKNTKQKLQKEFVWLIGVGVLAVVLEYFLMLQLTLSPVLSLISQGIIGLMVIGYIIRMVARVWNAPETDT